MRRFEGRSAIVTGGSSGIGLAVAERLSGEGAAVVVLAAPADEQDLDAAIGRLRSEGREVEGLTGDVSQEEVAAEVVERCVSRFGGVDVLVNNAGGGYWAPFEETDVAALDRTLAVNVRGTFMCTRLAVRHMTDGRGAVVNIASTASFMGEEFQAGYNAAKAGVAALTRSLAVDLAPRRIRVNAVAPGWVATRATLRNRENAEEWARHRSRIPLDRAAEPSEIAAVCAFLASDDASYVTGSVYLCDGGLLAGFRSSARDDPT